LQDIRKIWDVKSLLNWSQEYFISKGINQPKLSSELLLADALNFTRMQIYLNFDHRPSEKELAKFKEYILKRVEDMPIQYILQKAFFRNLELYVDENVLIPRPETELLVDRVLNVMSDIVREKVSGLGNFSGTDIPDIGINILEIGTGSGAIALSIIKEAKPFIAKSLIDAGKNGPPKIESQDDVPAGSPLDEGNSSAGAKDHQTGALKSFNAMQATEIASFLKLKLTATEKSRAALEVALKNAKNLLTQEEIKDADFIEADIIPPKDSAFISEPKGNTGELGGKIDIVVSNPPYISENNYGKLPREVRDFEPKCALLAGETGLEIYKKILEKSQSLFGSSSSFFVFEVDPNVSPGLQKFISESMGPGKANIEVFKDYNQLDRIMVIKI
jgi:release factor-specific protein-(glutamine-N5) methyltransferase